MASTLPHSAAAAAPLPPLSAARPSTPARLAPLADSDRDVVAIDGEVGPANVIVIEYDEEDGLAAGPPPPTSAAGPSIAAPTTATAAILASLLDARLSIKPLDQFRVYDFSTFMSDCAHGAHAAKDEQGRSITGVKVANILL